jgi:competence protein ComEA
MRPISIWTMFSLGVLLPLSAQDPWPPGPGKELVERICAPCHGVYPLTQRNRSKAAWESLVDNMETRGAKGTDAELKAVVQYLVANFGVPVVDKINVNKAGARSLTNFFKLFPEEAEAIIAYREKNGDFREWQDLTKVQGLDAKKIEAKKDSIFF